MAPKKHRAGQVKYKVKTKANGPKKQGESKGELAFSLLYKKGEKT